jgi:peptidoglycan pentaglycine glycine transferase (the first glycine)
MPIIKSLEWDKFLKKHPNAHLLQTTIWGELKSSFGWEAVRVAVEGAAGTSGAQVLFRRLPLGQTFGYIPKGPLGDWGLEELNTQDYDECIWHEIDRLCRRKRAVFLKVEPDILLGDGEEEGGQLPEGFTISPHAIQPLRTIVVDLCDDEEQILARMKQKTRYNIRLAQRKGVTVQPSSDIDLFFRLMQATGERDEFGIHTLDYYHKVYDLFYPNGACEMLLAEYNGEPLATLLVFAWGKQAWYLYGASVSEHRERMPTYLLQWEAMRWARGKGCIQYDMWGIPDYDVDRLEAEFSERSDGLWGIYRFKRGFGGRVVRSAGPWDRVYQPLLYNLYLRVVNRKGEEL